MLNSTIGSTLGTCPSLGARPQFIARAFLRNPAQSTRQLVVRKNKIGDDLLDFVTAGPKLRKWYGAGERPTDGAEPGQEPEEEPEEPPSGEAVLVTDADGGGVGEQVVLQLILARQELKLLVKDVGGAKTAYGPYTTPLPADAVAAAPAKALRGAKALVVLGRLPGGPGVLLGAAKAARVGHVVLLTAAPGASAGGGGFSLGGLLGGGGEAARDLKALAADGGAAAEAVRRCGIPYTILQVAGLTDAGRGGGVRVEAGGGSGGGGGAKWTPLSREGLGALVAAVVDEVPRGRGRTVLAQGAAASGVGAQEQQEAIAAAVAGLPEDS
ncbi:hypothetical protein HYH02_015303 [Chlamydomonas schloesseri]|uniref:NAD(P)-binding domain-containing protein n=1 Tax=Chlamydomonas schloesseri TaxID=2026947 RepID=A0A835SHN2_9CHLO|nr:hypothetical protein HYH02_015303 [Chlamydomonas schloesseri]|eukprot:KAG2423603.1 hypothetical protein HYH02_015303 [Chlamydomonas schloesseri]